MTYNKPGHHLVSADRVREWRTATKTDTMKSICMYCDEDVNKNKKPLCSKSCGTYDVWVDTTTFAQITLELH
jgi:hypothetical protein